MTVIGFHHVALSVSDLDASERWYADVFGLGVAFREEGEDRRAVVMTFPHGPIGVGLVQFSGSHDAFDPRRTGLDHVAFSVETGAILNLRDPDGIALALFWDRAS